jgi:hypothetical protein
MIILSNTGHTQNNGAVFLFTFDTAPFFCVCPVYLRSYGNPIFIAVLMTAIAGPCLEMHKHRIILTYYLRFVLILSSHLQLFSKWSPLSRPSD